MDLSKRKFLIAAAAGGAGTLFGGMGFLLQVEMQKAQYERIAQPPSPVISVDQLSFGQIQLELVRYATLAANSHNTQPWKFSLEFDSILILPDHDRKLSAVDPDQHHLYGSLGCAVENIVQAAPAFGYHATPHFEPSLDLIRILLEKAPVFTSQLFHAIPLRQSTRSLYDQKKVSSEHLKLLGEAGNSIGVRMLLFTEKKDIDGILPYLISGNSAQMSDPLFITELKTWIRFSYGKALKKRDGLFSKCSGSPMLPEWLGRLIFPLVFTKKSENRKYEEHLWSSSGVVVFVSDKDEPSGWIEAGRNAERFSLQATALGIRFAYINQPVEVAAVRGEFARFIGTPHLRPDLVMRFGYAPLLLKSLRRPGDEIIIRR